MENKNEMIVAEATGEVIDTAKIDVVPLELRVKRGLTGINPNTKKEVKFDAYDTKLVLPTYRDGKYIGECLRTVPVAFADDAFEKDNMSELTSEKELVTGTLFVKLEGLSPIFAFYEATNEDGKIRPINDKRDKKVKLYVNSGIVAFKKLTSNKSIFDVNGFRARKQAMLEAQTEEAEEEDNLPEADVETE